MSERHDIQEAILKNWANLGYITSSRIDDQLFLDDESLDAYLEAHKRLGLEAGYLSKIVEEKKLERDFIISKYDDLLYVLRTQTTCKPLYEIIIRELSALILHPVTRDIFYSISTGESITRPKKNSISRETCRERLNTYLENHLFISRTDYSHLTGRNKKVAIEELNSFITDRIIQKEGVGKLTVYIKV